MYIKMKLLIFKNINHGGKHTTGERQIKVSADMRLNSGNARDHTVQNLFPSYLQFAPANQLARRCSTAGTSENVVVAG
jgi:hypothetical protein